MRLPFAPLVAGVALLLAGLGPVAARQTSPVATPVSGAATPAADAEAIEALFVQGFDSATLGEAGPDGTFTLTLTGIPEQVVYFADRPNREVGILPVTDWVQTLAGMGDDPPNAALVAAPVEGETEIVVVELLGAEGDRATGELTYRVRLLENLAELDMELAAEPLLDVEAGKTFASGNLFIDDALMCYSYPFPPGPPPVLYPCMGPFGV